MSFKCIVKKEREYLNIYILFKKYLFSFSMIFILTLHVDIYKKRKNLDFKNL